MHWKQLTRHIQSRIFSWRQRAQVGPPWDQPGCMHNQPAALHTMHDPTINYKLTIGYKGSVRGGLAHLMTACGKRARNLSLLVGAPAPAPSAPASSSAQVRTLLPPPAPPLCTAKGAPGERASRYDSRVRSTTCRDRTR